MSIPVMQFVSPDWNKFPGGTNQITIELLAFPPVGAALQAMIYAKPISPPNAGWSSSGQAIIDNLAYTAPTPSMTFKVAGGNYYAVKLQGEAHLLMPGYDEIDVQVRGLVDGKPIEVCPTVAKVNGTVAGLIGMLYFQIGS